MTTHNARPAGPRPAQAGPSDHERRQKASAIFDWLRAVKQVAGLGESGYQTALDLIEYFDDDLCCFRSGAELGDAIGRRRQTAAAALDKLVDVGLLEIVDGPDRRRALRSARRPPKTYRATIPAALLPAGRGKTQDGGLARSGAQNSEGVLRSRTGRLLPSGLRNHSMDEPMEDTGTPSSVPVSSSNNGYSSKEPATVKTQSRDRGEGYVLDGPASDARYDDDGLLFLDAATEKEMDQATPAAVAIRERLDPDLWRGAYDAGDEDDQSDDEEEMQPPQIGALAEVLRRHGLAPAADVHTLADLFFDGFLCYDRDAADKIVSTMACALHAAGPRATKAGFPAHVEALVAAAFQAAADPISDDEFSEAAGAYKRRLRTAIARLDGEVGFAETANGN